MSYCIKCGKQNPDTAKFCTSCGTTLKFAIIPSTPMATPEVHYQKESESPSKNKAIWLVIGIIAFLGVGGYLVFFNKNTETTIAKTDEKTDTATALPVLDTAESINNSTKPSPPVSKAVPLKPGNTEADATITQSEVTIVSQRLKSFYQCENDGDISCLLSYYNFPVSRYYQLNNASYDDLHKLFIESFTKKLNYHHITIKWDYCTVEYAGNGYKAILYADYEFRRQNSPDENRSRSIQIIIYMNTDYMITGINEN